MPVQLPGVSVSPVKVTGSATVPTARMAPGAVQPIESAPAPVKAMVTPGSTVSVGCVVLSPTQDRKSTRLNSSHSQISYAVFCLKKKKSQHEMYLYLESL